jgi:transcriptional regulator with XRE-family HTH domain
VDLGGIGRRIAQWRDRRGLTQQDFGVLMDKSRRWVQDLEGGQRQADPRLSVIERAAEVLGVPIETLLSDTEPAGSECVDAAEVVAIRDALQRPEVITGTFPGDAEPLTLGGLRQAVAYGWDAFQAAHYSTVGRVLPGLVVDAHRTAGVLSGDGQLHAFGLVSMANQLASATLLKLGDLPLAWHAADRGIHFAERATDPVTIASAARRLADAMLNQGQAGAGVDLVVSVAERLGGDLDAGRDAGLSVLGMLYLKGAVAAAERGSASDTAGLLGEAEGVATRLGHDGNAQWSAFGPTNVRLHRVSTLIRLERGRDAVAAAATITPGALAGLPRERRANTLVEIAHGYFLDRQRDAALAALLDAERLAPQEVHCRPATRRLVETLVALNSSGLGWQLRGLAERCQLAV